VDHARDVPLPGTAAGFVEVLPHTACEDVLEVRVTVDRLLRQLGRNQPLRSIAKDIGSFAADDISATRRASGRGSKVRSVPLKLIARSCSVRKAAPASAGDAVAPDR
jgi:hypothetical protein